MTRCVRCGEKPSTPGEADLIETHEMCRRCRPDVAALLDALAAHQAAEAARRTASDALAAAVKKELDR